jgi:hypothetical protein
MQGQVRAFHNILRHRGNMLQLVYSLIMVAMCVEIWHQPNVIDAADAQLDRIGEPLP